MKVWQALFNVLGLVLIVIWFAITIKQKEQFDDFYNSAELKIKTEYATEAAMYTYIGNNIFWLDTYSAMMCNEYELAEVQSNRDRIVDSIDAAIYVSDSSIETLVRNKNLGKFSVQLIPITFKINENEMLMLDAFGEKVKYLNKEKDLLAEATSLSELQYLLETRGIKINATKIEEEKPLELAKVINKALMTSYVGMNTSVNRVAYLPVYDIEKLGINSIKGKTLIIVQKDFEKWRDRIITTAGYEKVERKWVIGFVENGIKYYCLGDEVPEGIKNAPGNKMFKTIYEAADAGYIPATQYFK